MHDIKITNDIAKMVMVKKVVVKRKGELYLQPGGKTFNVFWKLKKNLSMGSSSNIKINLKNGTSQDH